MRALNLSAEPYRDLRSRVSSFSPDIVGISLRNLDTTDRLKFFYYYASLNDTLAAEKSVAPSVPIMTRGAGFSLFPRTIMERHEAIDFGVYLEGAESAPELLRSLRNPSSVKGIFYRREGRVAYTGPRLAPDFACLPAPRRDFVEVHRYDSPLAMGVQAKRGCVLECAYCTYPHLNGRHLQLQDAVSAARHESVWQGGKRPRCQNSARVD